MSRSKDGVYRCWWKCKQTVEAFKFLVSVFENIVVIDLSSNNSLLGPLTAVIVVS